MNKGALRMEMIGGGAVMAVLSPARKDWPILPGLNLISRGKVRDTYGLGNGHLLVVATDGISIFDHVLNALVPEKGIVLNLMNYFWLKFLAPYGFKTHFVEAGAAIDDYLPPHLRGDMDLQSRAMVVKSLKMSLIEFIARAVLAGSAVEGYKKDCCVCGHHLPPGLQDGDLLPCILDTPTTKAAEGHDENLPAEEIRRRYPEQTYILLQAFQIAFWHAKQKGIFIADTKFEFDEEGIIGDEILTPDSSRFWEDSVWLQSRKQSERKAPPSYDKQLVREWGKGLGINKLDPKKPEEVAEVHAMKVPENLIGQTTQAYRYIFWRLAGDTIDEFRREKLGIAVPKKGPKNIVIVCGSESDWPTIKGVVEWVPSDAAKIRVHAMSCHRNPEETRKFAISGCDGADILIGVGGKALAQPGVIDAFAHAAGKDLRVVGVALGNPGTEAFEAARLSISQIPGEPVVMDEINGKPYIGPEGLQAALQRIITGELPPARPRAKKPPKFDIFKNH